VLPTEWVSLVSAIAFMMKSWPYTADAVLADFSHHIFHRDMKSNLEWLLIAQVPSLTTQFAVTWGFSATSTEVLSEI